jgi:hypothetical protein
LAQRLTKEERLEGKDADREGKGGEKATKRKER